MQFAAFPITHSLREFVSVIERKINDHGLPIDNCCGKLLDERSFSKELTHASYFSFEQTILSDYNYRPVLLFILSVLFNSNRDN